MGAFVDITGQRYGRLVAQERVGANAGNGNVTWRCICDCGREVVTSGTSLRKGATKSCGCLKLEVAAKVNARHGGWGSPEYSCWHRMRQRCENPNNSGYPDYGARGISVSPHWQKFENFLADMGSRPSTSHSIGRLDNDRGYEPGNCARQTCAEQARNTRRTRNYTLNGETLCLTDWAHRLSVDPKTLYHRIEISGWPIERALTTAPSTVYQWPRHKEAA